MPSQRRRSDSKRTAILVVHGMGSQRPLDTARGVVEAVEGKYPKKSGKRMWTHPEQRGSDIDLPVITTRSIVDPSIPPFDFHELYWAHLMSETRAVAVLLWLFELARRGPRLKRSIRALYRVVLAFLALLVLSVSLLAIQFIFLFFEQIVRVSANWHQSAFESDFRLLVFVALATVAIVSFLISAYVFFRGAFKLAIWSIATTAIAGSIFAAAFFCQTSLESLTNAFLPVLVALVAVKITMGWWGVGGLGIAYVVSALALFGFSSVHPTGTVCVEMHCWLPWSITAFWSSIAAWFFIAIYLALYALFLQPYLGDAARYFRNSPANVAVRREIRKEAVGTLEDLHLSGKYDRIVVVAHSLGTVIAYDMLRAYYSRIDEDLPDPQALGSDLEIVDHGTLTCEEARNRGRAIIAKIQKVVEATQNPGSHIAPHEKQKKAWLVTDFVTMGSPLTHAHYLMCDGNTEHELKSDFRRRVRELEFPTCPPPMPNGDGRLTYISQSDRRQYFHHGGLFALTRWTNLYFPVFELLWGDAIGGPVAPIFGKNIVDVEVYDSKLKRTSFFAHVKYWAVPPMEGSEAPHIRALINAINLEDKLDRADPSNQSPTA